MADDPTPTPKPDPEDAPKDPAPTPDDTLGDAGKRALAAERQRARDEKKRADELAAKLREIEDRDKSETQRAQAAAAEAAKRAEAAESRLVRLEVAADKGLTPGQAKRLVGTTREELEADADEILAEFSPRESGDDDRRPRERFRSGAAPDREEEPDIDAAVAATRRF